MHIVITFLDHVYFNHDLILFHINSIYFTNFVIDQLIPCIDLIPTPILRFVSDVM